MIEAGLCTKEQFKYGKEGLLDRTARLFEQKSEVVVVEDYGVTQRINKRRKIKDNRDEVSQADISHREFDGF